MDLLRPDPASLFGLCVLIVDADAPARGATRALAYRLGLAVACAADADAAVASLRDRAFDAVLLDPALSTATGASLVRAIRALPGRERAIPIVALCDADGPDAGACRDAGANARLERPAETRRLAALLARLCRAGAADPRDERRWIDAAELADAPPAATRRPAPPERPRDAVLHPIARTQMIRAARAADEPPRPLSVAGH